MDSLDNNARSGGQPGWCGLQGRGGFPAGAAQGHARGAGLQPGLLHLGSREMVLSYLKRIRVLLLIFKVCSPPKNISSAKTLLGSRV